MDGPLHFEPDSQRNFAFFCPDIGETSTITRVKQFIEHGYHVTVFGFRRKRYNTAYRPEWSHVTLGETADGKYWQRLSALFFAVPAIFTNRRVIKRATAFYARNLDQLLLALLARMIAFSHAPIAYEVLDIPPILIGHGFGSKLLRFVERLCLKHTRVLVLSSPAFHRAYYDPIQQYAGEWFLLENKLHPSIADLAERVTDAETQPGIGGSRPWVIGYFGLIRGEATFDLMTRVADRLKGRVIFRFRGILTTVDQANFEAAVACRSNMVYGGPYRPYYDLQELYRDVDFAWAIDLENADHNSRWLLPCRFYEAGYFGVPCLAVQGFETGSMLDRHRIGWTFDAPLEESLVHFFSTVTHSQYADIRNRLRNVPAHTFVGSREIAQLSEILES
jgi:succinoglycan biosynthesis protein ExoL